MRMLVDPKHLVAVLGLAVWLGASAAIAASAAQKLGALEAARQAGILSEAEYARNKAEIVAQSRAAAPRIDAATRQKLNALEAARQAGILSNEEYQRKKAALLRGRAVPAQAVRPQQGTAPARPAAARKGRIFRHPIGFSCWIPAGWRVQTQGEALQIVPPNADPQRELYVIIGDTVAQEGIQRPDDPQVIQYLDQQVKSLTPALQRIGQPQPVSMSSGQGVLLEWQAQGNQGQVVRARAYACIIKGWGVALIAFGLKDQIDSRNQDLKQMFASFGFGEGQKDPQLVGAWTLVSTSAISNQSPFETAWSRAKMASETQSRLAFQADGTWSRTDVSQTIAGAGGVWLDTGPQKSSKQGKWNAANGVLYMMWQDGSWEEYKYQVQRTAGGRQLRLVSGKTGEVWKAQ